MREDPEYIKQVLAFQDRMTAGGGRGAASYWAELALSLAVFAAIEFGAFSLIAALPRHPDNSMKLAYLAPVVLTLALVAAAILRSGRIKRLPARMMLWAFVLQALLYVAVEIIDAANR